MSYEPPGNGGPYRTPPEDIEALVRCPKCDKPVLHAWQYVGGERQLIKVLCRNCGWQRK